MTQPFEPFFFAVISDSHFHPEGGDPQSAYDTDSLHNARNRAVIETINNAGPDFVIHLGDVPHPVPGKPGHTSSLELARNVFDILECPKYVVPGNHDVGDKPDGWAGAPSAGTANHAVFSRYWGPPFFSIDHLGIHFVFIDTPILNSGNRLEKEQSAWLESDLEAAFAEEKRIFVSMHYPPFLCDPDEDEHYDNIAEPARGWLLNQFKQRRVEGVFCGHVHHFFWNHHNATDYYMMPSTAFMRPEFSELCPVAPGADYGRDEVAKLGYALVHVGEEGHSLCPVRIDGDAGKTGVSWKSCNPLGVSLTHDLDGIHDIPLGNLDPLRRKRARNDLAIHALWELRLSRIRLPAADIKRECTRQRLKALAQKGLNICIFSTSVEAEGLIDVVLEAASILEGWEIVTREGMLPSGLDLTAVQKAEIPVWLSIMYSGPDQKEGVYFSHFPRQGFHPDDSRLGMLLAAAPAVSGFIGRIPDSEPVFASVAALARLAKDLNCECVAHFEFPLLMEGLAFTDDGLIASRVSEVYRSTIEFPAVRVLLDTFYDHDRGYYPRNGLLDRAGRPRQAYEVLHNLLSAG